MKQVCFLWALPSHWPDPGHHRASGWRSRRRLGLVWVTHTREEEQGLHDDGVGDFIHLGSIWYNISHDHNLGWGPVPLIHREKTISILESYTKLSIKKDERIKAFFTQRPKQNKQTNPNQNKPQKTKTSAALGKLRHDVLHPTEGGRLPRCWKHGAQDKCFQLGRPQREFPAHELSRPRTAPHAIRLEAGRWRTVKRGGGAKRLFDVPECLRIYSSAFDDW